MTAAELQVIGLLRSCASWVLGVWHQKAGVRLSRQPYVAYIAIIFMVGTVLHLFAGAARSPKWLLVCDIVYKLSATYLVARLTTRRSFDVGWDKSKPYCGVIGIFAFYLVICLMFKQTAEAATSDDGTISAISGGNISVVDRRNSAPLSPAEIFLNRKN